MSKFNSFGGGVAFIFLVSASTAWATAPQTLSVTLSASSYNGYNISCFGMKDGHVHASAYGGTAPYQYKWSNGGEGQDISHVAAGYYRVEVFDSNDGYGVAEITLEQPLPMKMDVDVYEYPNGYNVSCYECFNGNASVVMMGGAAPFAVTWSDGPSGLDRYNLGPKDYKISVADANGCGSASATIYLRGPARSDWSMSGNGGSNPGAQYIGTSDAKDLVLKSNGQERLRLKSNGAIGLWGADTTVGPLYRDYDGTIRMGFGSVPTGKCYQLSSRPYWLTKGNDFSELCLNEPRPLLGTLSNDALPIYTGGVERMRVTMEGKLGIGTATPLSTLHVAGDLLVRGGSYGDIVTSSSTNTGPVLWARNTQAAWGLSIDANGKGHILGDWNNPHPVMTFAYDKVGIGTEDMPNDDYSLFVGKGILTEKVKVALQNTSEWSDHVFQPNYRLMPLKEVDAFIKEHGHLPGVPSATTMVEQGLDVVKTDAMLLEKVEELTLHLITMEKRMSELEKENLVLRQLVRKP